MKKSKELKLEDMKFPTMEVEVYKCKRCIKGSKEPWVQRPEKLDGKIILKRPNNCTYCKSPSWWKDRS